MVKTIVINTDVARMLIYRFLAQAFSYPEPAVMEILKDNKLWDELKSAGDTLNLEAGQILNEARAFTNQYKDDMRKLLYDLQIEYTYLFINAVPHVPAPPYESVYLGQGRLMGEPVSEVIANYREGGLNINKDHDVLPDHIATELEFMFYLVRQEAIAGKSTQENSADLWRQRQSRFFSNHLSRWVPPFSEKVKNSHRKVFYRLMSELLETYIKTENKLLRCG